MSKRTTTPDGGRATYEVRRAFAYRGTWYTGRNGRDPAEIPKKDRERFIRSGALREIPSEGGPAEAPADSEHTGA